VEFYESGAGGAVFQIKEHPGRYEINGQQVRGGWELDGKPVKKGTEGAEYVPPPAGAVWRQPPNTIYFVAGREFDDDRVQAEQNRFRAALRPVEGSVWSGALEDIHAATLREWWHTRQLVRTFWAECRRRMFKAGVPEKLIEACIPKPPP
jgi:hypothetical protein